MTRTPPVRRLAAVLLAAVLAVLAAAPAVGAAPANAGVGAVYTLTNQVAGNAVAIFTRARGGSLRPAGAAATGGAGTGAGLGSQGALALDDGGRWLFAVNAGSDEISSFAVAPDGGLTLVDRVASGGVTPISLTVHRGLLYALNAGGDGNIAGFTVGPRGRLTALAHSARPLSGAGANPAQVQFSPAGRLLVVTEKATNRLLTYTVGAGGLAAGPMVFPSSGATPFGFAFARHNRLVVSEAGERAVSSYRVAPNGAVSVISGSVATDQAAACWIAVSDDGRFAYTTNAGSASITGYRVHGDGRLSRLDPAGPTATTGATPLDMALGRHGAQLYVLQGGARQISGFAIGHDGRLTPVNSAGGLPVGASGLAAW